MAADEIQITPRGLRTEFYNAIAQILTYDSTVELDLEPNDAEKEAIHHLLDALGKYYYGPVCTAVVGTYFQDKLAKIINPSLPDEGDHDDCPCVRSEKHSSFHRCKHGYYSG